MKNVSTARSTSYIQSTHLSFFRSLSSPHAKTTGTVTDTYMTAATRINCHARRNAEWYEMNGTRAHMFSTQCGSIAKSSDPMVWRCSSARFTVSCARRFR